MAQKTQNDNFAEDFKNQEAPENQNTFENQSLENETTENTLEEKWKKTYSVPKNEKDHYHVLLEKKRHDPNTGKRLSVPFAQKFNKKEWKQKKKILPILGFTFTVLYEPK